MRSLGRNKTNSNPEPPRSITSGNPERTIIVNQQGYNPLFDFFSWVKHQGSQGNYNPKIRLETDLDNQTSCSKIIHFRLAWSCCLLFFPPRRFVSRTQNTISFRITGTTLLTQESIYKAASSPVESKWITAQTIFLPIVGNSTQRTSVQTLCTGKRSITHTMALKKKKLYLANAIISHRQGTQSDRKPKATAIWTGPQTGSLIKRELIPLLEIKIGIKQRI